MSEDFKVKDITLAEFGRKEISIAESEMPGLMALRKEFKGKPLHRCGFLSLPIDGYVGAHIDEGVYYHTRNRYHLSILGKYQYFCGEDTIIVDPRTLFWFNNKMPHGAVNLGDETRITFVFDIPYD